MTSPDRPDPNHYNQPIPDPFDSKQFIEDPMHGPEVVQKLLGIPPRPNQDGTYHVPGGLYMPCGTTSFDTEGKPFVRISGGHAMFAAIRDSLRQREWVDRFRKGELPPIEEMGYPDFDFEAEPYLIIDKPSET